MNYYGFKYNLIIKLIKIYNNCVNLLSIFIADKTKRKIFRSKNFILKKGYSLYPRLKRAPSGDWGGGICIV